MLPNKQPTRYTQNILLQMLAVFVLLGGAVGWQWEVAREIYLGNQLNAVGWFINGGIAVLFLCGMAVLIARFFEYRNEEENIGRFRRNLVGRGSPVRAVDPNCLIAERYRMLIELNRRRARIDHSALAAALLAAESSRNSFPKFVHNVLILTGVFGTIISLSLSLLGASDLIRGGGQGGLGTMIFGMSTALSTTMTAILAYLIFGYFYIKLTDTQTYLISRIEEVTAVALLPHLQPNPEAAVLDYADSIRSANQLIARFDQSQQQYEHSVKVLHEAVELLSRQLELTPDDKGKKSDGGVDGAARLIALGEAQQHSAIAAQKLLTEAVQLLREGFRLKK